MLTRISGTHERIGRNATCTKYFCVHHSGITGLSAVNLRRKPFHEHDMDTFCAKNSVLCVKSNIHPLLSCAALSRNTYTSGGAPRQLPFSLFPLLILRQRSLRYSTVHQSSTPHPEAIGRLDWALLRLKAPAAARAGRLRLYFRPPAAALLALP